VAQHANIGVDIATRAGRRIGIECAADGSASLLGDLSFAIGEFPAISSKACGCSSAISAWKMQSQRRGADGEPDMTAANLV
jgi:hypothetical protein